MNKRTVTSSIVKIFLDFAMAVAVSGPSHSLAQSWTPARPYPTTVSRYAFAQDGENFYVISGAIGNTTLTAVRRYNARTNVWTSLADIPIGSRSGAAAIYGGKIYVAAGVTGGDAFQIYDIATNTWTAGAPRPGGSSRDGSAAGAYNNRIYLAGGSGSDTTLSIYNIGTNTWSAGPGVPQLYRIGGHTQSGQLLYLIGGFTGTLTNSNFSQRLDMATETWTTGPTFTPQRAEFALAAAGARLFAIGGDTTGGGSFDASILVNELDTTTWPSGTWVASLPNLPTPRQGNSAGFFSTGRAGGEIWSTGGFNPTTLSEHIFRPVPRVCQGYTVTTSTGPLVAATNDVGVHCDDCGTFIFFPFPIRFYGNSYGGGGLASNGNLQFNGGNISGAHTNLPATGFGPTIFPYWDNTRTDLAGGGIFTRTTATAPNREFNTEWRVSNSTGAGTANFAMRFFENSEEFEILYGARTGTFTGTIGIQRDSNSIFHQVAGPSAPFPAEGTRLIFTPGCCGAIAFTGAIGSNSATYPGVSGTQAGRVFRDTVQSVCGSAKTFPGLVDANPKPYDAYAFVNNGPATCVTFSINTSCTAGADHVFAVAYLNSFNPNDLDANYRGDMGSSPVPFNSFAVDVPAGATVILVVSAVGENSCPSYDVAVKGLSCSIGLANAASRKTHGSTGEFDIPLPLSGQPGVEPRSGQPASGNHKLVFNFNSDGQVTNGSAAVTAGTGTVGAPTFLGTTMTVPLSSVTDIQKLTLTLSGVTNTLGQVLPNTAVNMNVLLGDTTGNKAVNASDIGQTKSKSGQAASATNFRNDTTVSGSINSSDIGQVKANSGHSVP